MVLLLSGLITFTMASEANQQVVRANSDFTTDLYKILSRKDANLIFSPLSVHTVLSLAYQGAAGNTSQSFANALRLPEAKTASDGYKDVMASLNNVTGITLHIANKVYVKTGYKLKDSFSDVARSSFYSEVEQVNFVQATTAANTINTWVENKTNDKIKNLIQPDDLDELTRLVLVNAVYFKGNWADKFRKENTRKEPFYLNDNDKIDVDMMHINKKFNYAADDNLDAKILELPYENRNFSLVVVLPNQRNGIRSLEEKLASTDLSTLTSNLHHVEVNVALPKFKIESQIPLNEPLAEVS